MLKRNLSHTHCAENRASGYRYLDGSFLGHITDAMKDDILLQYGIIGKCFFSRFKHVYMSDIEKAQKSLPETPEIRAIAETPRRDGDNLSPRPCETSSQPYECGVEI